MEPSSLIFATVFSKISFFFSVNSILILSVAANNEFNQSNSNENFVLHSAEWEMLWLTKALISYLQLSPNEIFYDSPMEKEFIINQLQPALIYEGINLPKHLSTSVYSAERDSLMVTQEDVINLKRSCMIRMLHLSFGNSIFKQSLFNYVESSESHSTSLDGLWDSFQHQIDEHRILLPTNITIIINSWIKQATLPVVHVEIKNKTAKLRQESYLIDKSTNNYENNIWWIPLTWTSANNANFGNTTFKYWLYKKEDMIQLEIEEEEWVIFNLQYTGFYRVNYDEASWYRIIYALHFHPLHMISVINRASIISDAFNLAKAGIIPFKIALNSVAYITRETDYLPVETALTELKFLFKYFSGQLFSHRFNKFFLTLIKPLYNYLSQNGVNDLFVEKLQNKLTYWACFLGYRPCVKKMFQKFHNWKSHLGISITNYEKKIILCIVVKYNPSLEENGTIKIILNYYSKTLNVSDRAIFMSSLKCIDDLEILETVLTMLLSNYNDKILQKQEILYLLKTIATNSLKHADFMIRFISKYRDEMVRYYGNDNIIMEILESLNEILDLQTNLNKYYIYTSHLDDELIKAMDFNLNHNAYYQSFYINYYPSIIKWINDNRVFMLMEVEDEMENDVEPSKIFTRSFQLFKSYYDENSSPSDSFSSRNVNSLGQNASYIFWKRIFDDWAYLLSTMTDRTTKQLLEYHMLKIVSPIFDKLGFEEKPDDTYEDKVLRNDVIDWACRLEYPECILKALKKFKDWRTLQNSPISTDIQQTIYCTVIKYESDYVNYFIKKYIRTKNDKEKLAIEYAFGCVRDDDTIRGILSIILHPDTLLFTSQLRIISSINYYGTFGLQEFLRYMCIPDPPVPANEAGILKLNLIFEKLLSYISTDEQIILFEQCLEFYSEVLSKVKLSLRILLDKVIEELENINHYSANFSKWLKTTYTSFDYQLPKHLQPIKYEVFIIPDENFFYGLVEISLNVLQNSDRIILHAVDLFIDEINVSDLTTNQPIHVLFLLQHLDGRCEIYLDSIVKYGTNLLLEISFGGNINAERYGIFRLFYNKNRNTEWLIATQFQMTHARRAFPCFDEPSFKAKFTLQILRPNNYRTMSNMEIQYSDPSNRKVNCTWDVYKETELIPTYLVAFIICKHKIQNEYKEYLKYWSLRDSPLFVDYSLDVAHQAIKILSDYTKISLPMKKIDLVEIPGFDLLGMENWGIIILDDRLPSILANGNLFDTITFKEFIIVHEVVHTWFGNLVTCETWEYFWLNEGFTRYFEWRVMNLLQSQMKWSENFIVHIQQVAFEMDSQTSSLPLNNPKMNLITSSNVNKYDNSAMVHCKAPCIVRMMNHAFGDDNFRTAIKYYLKENMWSTSTPSKLWSAIDKTLRETSQQHQHFNQSVARIMETWTSQPGYPVVHVNRTNEQLIFKQERFFSKKVSESTELYWIPITIATKSKPNFVNTSSLFWMGSRTVYRSLPRVSDDEWIIVNIQQTGFYRVNYDINTWKNIFIALNQNDFGGIPEINRAQILNDLSNLAHANYISYDLLFIGAQYLKREKSYLPWKVFFNSMDNLYDKFDNPIISQNLKKYIATLITSYYNEIEAFKNSNSDYDHNLIEPLILTWASNVDLSPLISKSLNQFQKWLKNSKKPEKPDTFSLCIGLQHSSYSDWVLLRNRYLTSKSKFEKSTILNILGCSRNVTTLTEYIKFIVLDNYLKTSFQVKTALVSMFHVERISIDAILNFLIVYHDELNTRCLWKKVHLLLLAVSRNTYTLHQTTQLTKLIKMLENKNNDIKEQLQDYLLQLVIRKQWYDDHSSDIEKSLRKVEVFYL